eukprot:scaffold26276_cov55-Attheya_sp.AAC.2
MMRIMRHVVFMWAFLIICMMSPTTTALSDTADNNFHEKQVEENDLMDPTEVPSQSAGPTSSAVPTAVPTQSPTTDCTTDESGSYGITSTSGTIPRMTIIYYYEIETATIGDIFELSAVVLPKLEYAIANKLLRVMLGDTKNCGDNPDRRILSQETHGSSSRRRLDLVGLSSNPSDIVLEDYPCQMGSIDSDSVSTMCTVVQGELTLFLDEDEDPADSVEGPLAMGYDKVEGPPPVDELVTDDGSTTTSFGVLPMTLVAAAAGMLISLFVGFAVYKKRNESDDDDDEDEDLSHGSSIPSGEGEQVSYRMGMGGAEDEFCV